MGVELGSSIGAGIAVSSGPAIATFATVANLDSGPIGGWGKGLAAPEPFSFGSRNGSSSSYTEGLTMFNPTDQISFNSQAESTLTQAARPFSIAALVSIYGQPEAFSLLQPEVIKPVTKLDAAVQRNVFEPVIFPKPESSVASLEPSVQTNSALVTKVETKPEVGSKISTQVANESVIREQAAEEVKEEKAERVKAKHVIDKKAAATRIAKILARALQVIAKLGVSQKIKGVDLTVGLPTSNKQEIRGGEINSKDPDEKLPDKTWDVTVEQLRGLVFDSVGQVKDQVPKVVFDNHPVIVAKDGEVASGKNIARSHYQQEVTEGVIQDYPELAEALGVA